MEVRLPALDLVDDSLFPVVNVDGYEYSWTTDRLWRKNRQPTPVPFCTGIDPDKSWGYMWDAPGSQTFNSNPCSESHSLPPLLKKCVDTCRLSWRESISSSGDPKNGKIHHHNSSRSERQTNRLHRLSFIFTNGAISLRIRLFSSPP